jgi:hypothetical protein
MLRGLVGEILKTSGERRRAGDLVGNQNSSQFLKRKEHSATTSQ